MQGVLDQIEGEPCTVGCGPDGQCVFDIQDFFVTLVAPCQTAGCLVPSYSLESSEFRYQTSHNYDPVIAAVPIMALVFAATALTAYLLRHRGFWTAVHAQLQAAEGPSAASAAGGGDDGKAGAASADGGAALLRSAAAPVGELRFSDLRCEVPVRRELSLRGMAAALVPRRLRRWWAQAQPTQQQQQQQAAENGAAPDLEQPPPVEQQAGERATGGSWGGGGLGMKPILQGVSGMARRGELVGVLGPSGSGKSTLLGILAGSTEELDARSSLTGEVLLDGAPMRAAARRLVAFVPQDDTLLPTLTVEECLRYSALLRLPAAAGPEEVAARVAGAMQELGLTHVASSQVGGGLRTCRPRGCCGGCLSSAALSLQVPEPLSCHALCTPGADVVDCSACLPVQVGGSSGIRGVSGGERRRVTIGMELVCSPSVLVLGGCSGWWGCTLDVLPGVGGVPGMGPHPGLGARCPPSPDPPSVASHNVQTSPPAGWTPTPPSP